MLKVYNMTMNMIHRLRTQKGASMVEYGLLVALIAAVVMGTVATLGGSIDAKFKGVDTQIAG